MTWSFTCCPARHQLEPCCLQRSMACPTCVIESTSASRGYRHWVAPATRTAPGCARGCVCNGKMPGAVRGHPARHGVIDVGKTKPHYVPPERPGGIKLRRRQHGVAHALIALSRNKALHRRIKTREVGAQPQTTSCRLPEGRETRSCPETGACSSACASLELDASAPSCATT